MLRLKVVHILVFTLVFTLTVASVNAQGSRLYSANAVSAYGMNVLPPTNPILPPGVTDRGIIWGD